MFPLEGSPSDLPEGGQMRGVAEKPCNCEKSRCLKFYCECFSKNVYCTASCKCLDCHNNSSFQLQLIKLQGKKQAEKASGPKRGCTCKNTNCMKKYCECYQKKEFCTVACKCQDCHNNVLHKNSAHPRNNDSLEIPNELNKCFLSSELFQQYED